MTLPNEFHRFVLTISKLSTHIVQHAANSWDNITFDVPEPLIIKRYLLDSGVGIDYLNRNLAPLLSSGAYQVKFASVFIHQKPRITRHKSSIQTCTGDTPSCELGDLLVVYCLLDKNKVPIFRTAIICQAKKTESLSSRSQQCLYDSDTIFLMPENLVRNSQTSSPVRYLPTYADGRTKALHYLILNNGGPVAVQIPWAANLRYHWAQLLNRILVGDLGLPFDKVMPGTSDWNAIIQDLLNVGQGVIPSSINRGNSLSEIVNLFNDFGEYDKYSLELESETGLPIMFIIIRDMEFSALE